MRKPHYTGWYDGGMDMKMTMPMEMKMPKEKMMPIEDMMPMEEEMPAECMCEAQVPGQLAHAYVPWQVYCQAFPPREALMKGTLFPELWGVYPIPK